MAIKIIIYEDDKIFRESLIDLIQKEKEFLVLGAFPNCDAILEQVASLKPDVILMDIDLSAGINGIEATSMLKEQFSDINVMILSGFGDDDNVFNAIRAGAKGYILKGDDNEKIVKAIREIHHGYASMTPSIAVKIFQLIKEGTNRKEKEKLTPQQFKIIEFLKQGLSYKMIAGELGIQMSTVQVHIRNIYDRLTVHNKADAIRKVFR